MFRRFDEGGKGHLTQRELRLALIASLGAKPPKVRRNARPPLSPLLGR